MNELITRAVDLGKSVKNLADRLGGYLIAQSESGSQAYARHKARLAHVEALKVLMEEEASSIVALRDTLRQKLAHADGEERFARRAMLEETDGELQRLKVFSKAADYLQDFAKRIEIADEADEHHDDPAGATLHWLDRFNELAKKRLEPWRQDLLARALALESTVPGNVSLRTLWAIGILDYEQFTAFSVLLDLSSVINGSYCIPGHVESVVIPECQLGRDIRIGQLVYQLNDTEILGYRTSHRHVKKGESFDASYRDEAFTITCDKADLTLAGVGATRTGKAISFFYEQREHPLGKELFDKWIDGLKSDRQERYTVVPKSTSECGR